MRPAWDSLLTRACPYTSTLATGAHQEQDQVQTELHPRSCL